MPNLRSIDEDFYRSPTNFATSVNSRRDEILKKPLLSKPLRYKRELQSKTSCLNHGSVCQLTSLYACIQIYILLADHYCTDHRLIKSKKYINVEIKEK